MAKYEEGAIVNFPDKDGKSRLKKIKKVLRWKVWYDTKTEKVLGTPSPTKGHLICVAEQGGELPLLQNLPHWVEEREAIMLVF
jgi:hypothetical protein